MSPGGPARMGIALGVLAVLAVLVWRTMEPGKYQQLTWLLLGFFALRVILGGLRTRKIEGEAAQSSKGRLDVED